MKALLFLAILSTVIWVSVSAFATTFYVDGAVSSSGDGKSWGTALKTIQEGIDAASDGDTVIVAQGTYLENVHLDGKNIVLTSTDPLDPAVVAGTVIDGNRLGSVVTFSGAETEDCILSGFTIQNGNADSGGGILGATSWYSDATGATIEHNIIAGNRAFSGGGLYHCQGTIQNNLIVGNLAGQDGGGLAYCDGTIQNNTIRINSGGVGGGLSFCMGAIQNNTIAGNSATGNSAAGTYAEGGALAYCDGTIQNNTITGNLATGAYGHGAGLFFCQGTIQKNTISENSAGGFWASGGGLFWCNGTIENNTILFNSVLWHGGGLASCMGTIRDNAITGNYAQEGGGLHDCSGTIHNNTIAGNLAGQNGAGLGGCDGTIQNCIIWRNSAPTGPQLHQSSIPTHSCIEGWTEGGEGNITDDPRVVDPDGPDDNPDTWEDNDYRLSAGSLCIDAGINEDWMWTATDLDGNPRVFNGGLSLTVDMGAYEYGSWSFRISQVLVETTGELQLTWTSRPGDEYVVWSCTDMSSGDWTAEGMVPSAGASTSWTDPNPGGSRKFYRVEQL